MLGVLLHLSLPYPPPRDSQTLASSPTTDVSVSDWQLLQSTAFLSTQSLLSVPVLHMHVLTTHSVV